MRGLTDQRTASMQVFRLRARYAWLVVFLFFLPPMLSAGELSQQTLKAWDEYIQGTNKQMEQRLAGNSSFLWIDEEPGRCERVRHGDVLVSPANQDIPKKVPEGLIHDWLGAVFIPNATIQSVFAMLSDYDRYDQFYNPAVIKAKFLGDSGGTRRFSLLLAEKAPFVTAAVASEYASQTFRLDKQRWYTVTHSVRVQEIDNYGQVGEHELPPDKGSGYIWRLYSIERFEEKDGGVYAELEAIALSRNIPFELQWLVKPILQRLPSNSMMATLQKTRDAVLTAGIPKSDEVAKLGTSPDSVKKIRAITKDHQGPTTQQTPGATSLGFHSQN